MKTKLTVVLCTIVLSIAFCASFVSAAADSHANKIIKAEMKIDAKNFNLEEAQKKDKTIFIASPFGDSLSAYGLKVEKDTVLSYEFYTPTPLAGMGGIELQLAISTLTGSTVYLNMSSVYNEYSVKDGSGEAAIFSANISSKLTNGWYKRSIAFPSAVFKDAAEVRVQHIFLASCILNSDIAALRANGKENITAYYKNFKVVGGEDERSIFDEVNGGATFSNWQNFEFDDSSISINSTNAPYLPSQKTGFEGFTYYFQVGKKLSLSLVNEPNPVTVQLKNEEKVFYTGREYDMTNVVATSGASLKSVNKDGMPQAISGNIFTPSSDGEYIAVFEKAEQAQKASIEYSFTAYNIEMPVILTADIKNLATECEAGEKYLLPDIKAFYKDEKTFATTVTVTKNSADFKVENDEQGKYFIPTAKASASYEVTYTAKNQDKIFVKSITVNATDYDYPIAVFEGWPSNIEIGSNFTLPEIIFTDKSDGKLTDYTVAVQNTYGEFIEIQNKHNGKTIRPIISGLYTVTASAIDSDLNRKDYTYKFNVNPIKEAVYTVRAYVPEAKRASGIKKEFNSTLFKNVLQTTQILEGDKLFFDVYSRTPMAGIGTFSGQFYDSFHGKEWPHMYEFYSSSGIKDQNGLSMVPSTDISSKLKDINGNSVWYTREVELKNELFAGKLAHYSFMFSTSAQCGEFIEVSYRNVYILRKNGLKIPILPSVTPPDVGIWTTENISSAYVVGELDPAPVLLDQFIPTNGELGKDVHISDKVIFDFLNNKIIAANLTVTDIDGREMPLTKNNFGYIFNTKSAGEYRINYFYYENGIKKSVTSKLSMQDSLAPEIIFKNVPDKIKAGQTINLPQIECKDYGSLSEDISIDVKAFYKSREVKIIDEKIKNAQIGQYMLIYTVKDKAGNQTVERVYIDVDATEKKSCGTITANLTGNGTGIGALLTVGGSLMLLSIRRKKVYEK